MLVGQMSRTNVAPGEGAGRGKALLQRRLSARDEYAGASQLVSETLKSPGQPLDAKTRAFMESRFGHDFTRVRVHTGTSANASAHALRAHAYAVNNHIVFNDGGYAPHTQLGRLVLAHELAHTVQQRDGSTTEATAPVDFRVSDPSDPAELEAESAAEHALTSGGVGPFASGLRHEKRPQAGAASGPRNRPQSEALIQRFDWGMFTNPRSPLREALSGAFHGSATAVLAAASYRQEADRRQGGLGIPGGLNGPADALRHCYWASLITREVMTSPQFTSPLEYGTEDDARGFLLNHEDVWGGRQNIESQMDQHNNEVGINIGSGAATFQRMAVAGRALSQDQIFAQCFGALNNGLLLMLNAQCHLTPTRNWRTMPASTWTNLHCA